MTQRIVAIGFIFVCITVAWIILGATVLYRTQEQDDKLRNAVGQLWGSAQTQQAPTAYWISQETIQSTEGEQIVHRTIEKKNFIPIQSSRIDVNLELEHRRKGLLWYAIYQVVFDGTFTVANETNQSIDMHIDFALPNPDAVYDDFRVSIDNEQDTVPNIISGRLVQSVLLSPHTQKTIQVSYKSRGMDEWRYRFGSAVNQVTDFALVMHTDFDAIDFPQSSMSPTQKL